LVEENPLKERPVEEDPVTGSPRNGRWSRCHDPEEMGEVLEEDPHMGRRARAHELLVLL
jgi:hypothetical protein